MRLMAYLNHSWWFCFKWYQCECFCIWKGWEQLGNRFFCLARWEETWTSYRLVFIIKINTFEQRQVGIQRHLQRNLRTIDIRRMIEVRRTCLMGTDGCPFRWRHRSNKWIWRASFSLRLAYAVTSFLLLS